MTAPQFKLLCEDCLANVSEKRRRTPVAYALSGGLVALGCLARSGNLELGVDSSATALLGGQLPKTQSSPSAAAYMPGYVLS
mmetsp:Transcript_51078/g.90861  ORF Transcript_51078/g.90861 Transcript_51078/m.90861 type:complete len:82 (-) Transcript_51078:1054-1299(-)